MSYSKQNFSKGMTLTADHLNNIENGIVSAHDKCGNYIKYDMVNSLVLFYSNDALIGSLPLEIDVEKPLKIVFIGNSYSECTCSYMYDFFETLGLSNFRISIIKLSGCSIDTHWSNAQANKASYTFYTYTGSGTRDTASSYTIKNGLEADDWDWVVLSQSSNDSGQSEKYVNLQNLIDYVKGIVPSKTKLAFNMTWAWQSTYSKYPSVYSDSTAMYNQIVECMKNEVLNKSEISLLIPNGTTIQNARVTDIGEANLFRDGTHLNANGCFMAGLTATFSLLNAVYNNSYPFENYDINSCLPTNTHITNGGSTGSINTDNANDFYSSVLKAFQSPLSVSSKDDASNNEPEITPNDGVIQWTKSAYYKSSDDNTNLTTGTSTALRFWATQVFTKETLPNGSVITIAENYKYRPEAWISSTEGASSRPVEVSGYNQLIVDDAWWDNYTIRGFNICHVDGESDLSNLTVAEMNEIFSIVLPAE